MKPRENILNYILSIGFVFLITIFLISMIGITKYSLSDENVVKEHVQKTKNLIDDINEVEKSVEKRDKTQDINEEDNIKIKYTNFDNNIINTNDMNMRDGKGILTITFDSEVEKYENFYYLRLKENSTIEEKEIVIFETPVFPGIGKIISIEEDNKINILNFETQNIEEIEKDQIFGRILLKNG